MNNPVTVWEDWDQYWDQYQDWDWDAMTEDLSAYFVAISMAMATKMLSLGRWCTITTSFVGIRTGLSPPALS